MRRSLVLILLFALLAASPTAAQTPPAPPAPPAPPPAEPTIAVGVTIARIPVGGLTKEQARAAVQAEFDKKLMFSFRKRRWSVSPATLGSYPYLERSLAAALTAQPNAAVKMRVRLHMGKIRRYVAYVDRVMSRAPKNSVLLLRNLRPYLTKPRKGVDVKTLALERAIVRALVRTERGTAIALPATILQPTVTRINFGPTIVIRRESRRLYLYRNMTHVRTFRIAVGMPRYPTPLGRYHVISKERNPTWDPPNSPWAAGLGPVPPGPSNPLGTRWIGTSAPAIGIHGTPQPWTVGTAASHGCIRMYMSEVEWLFERVSVGTPVFIVRA
jgi:lipoprotein-anchoring transpeptidase ErfK/SrfK